MPRQMWDREERTEYRKLYKEYKREGYDDQEAKRLARQEVKEIMGNRLDFASDLYKNTLEDLN
jgi:hypothetical protein|tara:strand:- start:5514 stop:5702 length:189 start_codon:yes stop_codon:yes gene_type:complete